MKKLIITEKANAARRISTILSDGKSRSSTSGGVTVISFEAGGDEYDVVSLRGHIIELDYPEEYNDWSATNPADLVHAPQVKTVKVKSILNTIKDLASKADEIVIATDYDREGELIGMETVKEIGTDLSRVRRAKFSALTKGEVEAAFADLTEPNERLADAAEARQIIDLSWGAVLTRLISLSSGQVGRNFMSVGRVQSPTLKLLVDRHEEIESFVPKPYWDIVGKFGMLAFKGEHSGNPFWDRDEADAILSVVEDAKFGTVATYEGVASDLFERIMKSSADMSYTFGSDIGSAIRDLGRVMEDPIQGLTRLRRQGIMVSREIEDQVSSLVEQNRLYFDSYLVYQPETETQTATAQLYDSFAIVKDRHTDVIAMIDALPDTPAAGDYAAVMSAFSAYERLNKDEKAKVTNYADLLAAEAAVKNVIREQTVTGDGGDDLALAIALPIAGVVFVGGAIAAFILIRRKKSNAEK